MIAGNGKGQCARSAPSEMSEDDGIGRQETDGSRSSLRARRTCQVHGQGLYRTASQKMPFPQQKDALSPTLGPTAASLFPDLGAVFEGAEHQERCGIGAIIPPTLPPWIGEFVCEIKCTLPTLLTFYTTMPELPDHEGFGVHDFVRIE
jgi:hypothetical protein